MVTATPLVKLALKYASGCRVEMSSSCRWNVNRYAGG